MANLLTSMSKVDAVCTLKCAQQLYGHHVKISWARLSVL